jgi:exodeoxyribonuclease-3
MRPSPWGKTCLKSARPARVQIKVGFLLREGEFQFARYLDKQRRKRREYIYCGSLYVAQQKLDIKNWRDSQQSPGFLAPERAWMDEIVGNMGYVDALREVSREGEQYSWWPDNEQAEMLNLGWRFDYQVLTPGLRRCVRSARLPRQPRFSQHAPLIVDYDWTLTI